ncbi:MAG: uroporphyrinogen-III synthase [Acidobacteriota bacterium]
MGGLVGRRVLLTRPRGQGEKLAQAVEAAGGHLLWIPVLEVVPLPPGEGEREILAALSGYDWCAFTSANAVRGFLDWVEGAGLRWPLRLRVAAVGPATVRALEARGRAADLVPETHTGKALADLMVARLRPGRILLPGGDLAQQELPERLAAAGWETTRLVCYANRPVRLTAGDLYAIEQGLDAAVFASPSAVQALWSQVPESGRNVLRAAACVPIGPTTAEALRAVGLTVAALPPSATAEGVLAALEEALAGRPR